jgi:DNA-binding transcriptional LysR family regulator
VLPWPDIGPDSVIWPYVAEAFRKSGLDLPQSCIVSNSVPLGIAMLSAGSYLAMLPQSLIWFSGKQLGMRALPIQLPIRPPPVGIVTLRNRTVSPVAQLFIECARDVARPLR